MIEIFNITIILLLNLLIFSTPSFVKIEEIGKSLRDMMPFLDAKDVTKDK